MNAIQPSMPPVEPRETRKVTTRHKHTRRRLSHNRYRTQALENTAKLFVNVVLSAAAVYGLVQLLPYLWTQQQKWQEINTEVKQAEGRVNHLRQDFNRYFDPHQAEALMKEQSNLLEPGQRQVFWSNKSAE